MPDASGRLGDCALACRGVQRTKRAESPTPAPVILRFEWLRSTVDDALSQERSD